MLNCDVYACVTVSRTKRMLVDVVRCQQSGDNVTQILSIPATDVEVCSLFVFAWDILVF